MSWKSNRPKSLFYNPSTVAVAMFDSLKLSMKAKKNVQKNNFHMFDFVVKIM